MPSRQTKVSTPAGDCYRQLRSSEVTVYAWKKKHAHWVSELHPSDPLGEEHSRSG